MNKQITEDYCNKEVSALLKEKGFDVPVKNYFSLNKDAMLHNLDKKYGAKKNWNAFEICISRPSQSLALKWLREVHKIFVEPFVTIDLNGKYHYCFRLLNSICKDIIEPKDLVRIDFKDSYEEAVEAALLYVLKNLI